MSEHAQKLTIGSYNLHIGAVKNNPRGLVEDIGDFFTKHDGDILFIQEGGEARRLLFLAAERYKLKIFRGYGKPGQEATPILYRKSLNVKRDKSYFLSPPTKVDPKAAGPTSTKTKWLNSINFEFVGRKGWAGNIHTSPSVYLKKSEELVRRQINNAADAAREWKGMKFIGGDLNTLPKDDLRNPLEKAGLRSTQIELKPQDTMGGRNIDDIYFNPEPEHFKAVRNFEIKGASDHDMYVAVFEVEPTKRYRAKQAARNLVKKG